MYHVRFMNLTLRWDRIVFIKIILTYIVINNIILNNVILNNIILNNIILNDIISNYIVINNIILNKIIFINIILTYIMINNIILNDINYFTRSKIQRFEIDDECGPSPNEYFKNQNLTARVPYMVSWSKIHVTFILFNMI